MKKNYWNRILAVGDAASHVKATSGGGVITGMLSVLYAGRAISEFFREDDQEPLSLYKKN